MCTALCTAVSSCVLVQRCMGVTQVTVLEKKEVPGLQNSELLKLRGRKEKHMSCYFHLRVKSYFLKKEHLASDFV